MKFDKKGINKKEVEEKIKEFFEKIGEMAADDVKKIKKLGMSFNIRLGELRKNFCKHCYVPFIPAVTCEVRIKKGLKSIKCRVCGKKSRWKLKYS